MLLAAVAGSLGGAAATISSPWSNISFSSPTSSGTNEDRTITGSGIVTTSNVTPGIEYRINSGSWTPFAVFAIATGQTLGWRINAAENISTTEDVKVNGYPLDSFNVTVTGY